MKSTRSWTREQRYRRSGALRVMTLSRDEPLGISGGGHLPRSAAGAAPPDHQRGGSLEGRPSTSACITLPVASRLPRQCFERASRSRGADRCLADTAKIRVDENDFRFAAGRRGDGHGHIHTHSVGDLANLKGAAASRAAEAQGIQNPAAVEARLSASPGNQIEISEPLSSGKKGLPQSTAKEKETGRPSEEKEGEGASKAANEK